MEPEMINVIVDAGVALGDAIDMPAAAVTVAPMAPQLASIFDVSALLTHWNALLIAAVWIGIQSLKRAMPDEWFDPGKIAARLLPLAPMVACNIAVWVPGPWLDPAESAGQRVILGTILGAMTANFHTIASKLGLHSLLRLEADTRKLPKPAKVVSPPAPKDPPA